MGFPLINHPFLGTPMAMEPPMFWVLNLFVIVRGCLSGLNAPGWTGQKRWQKVLDAFEKDSERTLKHSAFGRWKSAKIPEIVQRPFIELWIHVVFLPCGFSIARWSALLLRDGSKMQRLDQTRFPRARGCRRIGRPCSENDLRRWHEVDLAKQKIGAILEVLCERLQFQSRGKHQQTYGRQKGQPGRFSH